MNSSAINLFSSLSGSFANSNTFRRSEVSSIARTTKLGMGATLHVIETRPLAVVDVTAAFVVIPSRKEIIGGDTRTGILANLSLRSAMHRSKCTSPAAAITCSPVSIKLTSTKASARFNKRKPSTRALMSLIASGSTATFTIAAAWNIIAPNGGQSNVEDSVAVFKIDVSNPPIANKFPAGTSSTTNIP